MKCKQTREVIDTASRHTLYSDSVTTHLSGCPDCRLHADGTASLLTLLSAQPRVEAPADFDIKVSMGIARAQAELANNKTYSLLALLKAQPRVEAPADFDFRLSAGIARAQSEPLSPAGVFERAWEKLARTLSFGQAAAAMGAAALIITASTVYINRDNNSPASTTSVATTRSADPAPIKAESAQVNKTSGIEPVRMIAAKSAAQGVKVRPAMIRNDEFQAKNNSSPDIASLERVFNPRTRQFVPLRRSFGLEEASVKLTADTPSF